MKRFHELATCDGCGGFVPVGAPTCPHCSSREPFLAAGSLVRIGIGLFGGSALAMTLMACYGAPCADDGSGGCRDYSGDTGADADADADAGDAADAADADAKETGSSEIGDATDAATEADAADTPTDGG